jgi:hypothetical protein
MGDACTLVCGQQDYAAALNALHETTSSEIEVAGDETLWTRVQVTFPTSTLTFTSMVRDKPGDQFSRLVLGMHNFFRRIDTQGKEQKELVLAKIANSEMFIGVVAEPEFSDLEGHFTCLFALARKLNALIFTGQAMQDADGCRLLGTDGIVN